MTRSEFDAKFNERYKESLLTLTDADSLKARLEKVSKEITKFPMMLSFRSDTAFR